MSIFHVINVINVIKIEAKSHRIYYDTNTYTNKTKYICRKNYIHLLLLNLLEKSKN